MTTTKRVHNHGPAEGPGLECPERTDREGQLRGYCIAPLLWGITDWDCPRCFQDPEDCWCGDDEQVDPA